MQIYLDYSATTPIRPEAMAIVQEVMTQEWGNPASVHAWGERAALVVERAREQVAALLNAPPQSVVFTSGGTEANNMAVMGIARQYTKPQHVIISAVEHAAIAEPVRLLEQWGWQVTRLPVDSQGRVNPLELQAALRPQTVLVSVIYGQSEVGTLQPIDRLGRIVQMSRQQGESAALFHTDAVQVAGRLPIDVQQLSVDLLSASSHKFYGPQGVGALYLRPGVEIVPLLGGGGHESGRRSGTPPVANIAGFGIAAHLALQELPTEVSRLQSLRDRLFDQLKDLDVLLPTGDRLYRLPHHVSFCLDLTQPGWHSVTGKTLVRQMNLAGIGISSGSACHSGQTIASSVLLAMGYDKATARTGIRITLGRYTTLADVDWAALALRQILLRSRQMPLLSNPLPS